MSQPKNSPPNLYTKMFYRFALYGFLKNLRFFEPFILLIFVEDGLTFFQIGLLYAIRDLATNTFEIPTGLYADSFGRRRAMIIAFLSYIIAFITFFFSSSFAFHALAMLCFASGEAFRSGTHKALILEYLKLNNLLNHKVAYYGRTRAASQFGSAINSLVAAALVFYARDYRYMFIAATLPYTLDLFNVMTYPKALDGDLNNFKPSLILHQLKATLNAFLALFKHPQAMRVILNSAAYTAFFKSNKDYLQPILQTFALSLPLFITLADSRRTALIIGLVYFVIYLFSSYASRSAHSFSQQFSTLARPINLTFLAGAACLLLAGLATWQNLIILSIVAFLALHLIQNLRKPLNVARISEQVPSHIMASGLSLESQFTTLLTVAFAPLLGFLADQFSVSIALTVFGIAMLFFWLFIKDS